MQARLEAKREAAEEARRELEEQQTPRIFGGMNDILMGAAGKRADMQ